MTQEKERRAGLPTWFCLSIPARYISQELICAERRYPVEIFVPRSEQNHLGRLAGRDKGQPPRPLRSPFRFQLPRYRDEIHRSDEEAANQQWDNCPRRD